MSLGTLRNESKLVELQLASPLVEALINTLRKFGYCSEVQGQLRGISGESHQFDIVSKRGADSIVLQLLPSQDSEKMALRIVDLRAKAWDCSPDLVVVIVPSQEQIDSLREFASLYNFVQIEADNPKKMCEDLARALASLKLSDEVG